MKKAEHGEVLLDEFIQFFNSVMQIQDFRSFLQASQNVCLIVKKLKRGDDIDTKLPTLKEVVDKANGSSNTASVEKPLLTVEETRTTRAKRRRENKHQIIITEEEDEKEEKKVEEKPPQE